MGDYAILNIRETGQRIRWLMEQNGLDVRDIQAYLGLATPQSIYHWFSGRNMPSVDNLYALSACFHVPVDAMLCGNRMDDFVFRRRTPNRHLYAYYEKFRRLKAG